MAVLVVRHAKAGDRHDWDGPDEARPLTAAGAVQAGRLVATLADFSIGTVLSSPYLRCRQTVAPLAAARGLVVAPSDALAEGAGRAAVDLVTDLAAGAGGADVLLCTHGDVLMEILEAVARRGVVLPDEVRLRKGSTWVLDVEGGRVVGAHYLEAPGA